MNSVERPVGSVVSHKEIYDAIYDAIARDANIPLYLVEQMGNQTTLILNKNTVVEENRNFMMTCENHTRCLGDLNIGDSCNEHFAFWDKNLANQYSDRLKNDPEYIQSVKDYWAWCDKMFSVARDRSEMRYVTMGPQRHARADPAIW